MATATKSGFQTRFQRSSKPGWVGIDVGTACLKAAQVERSGKKYFLSAGQVLPVVQRTHIGDADNHSGSDLLPEWPLSKIEKYRSKITSATLPRNLMNFRAMQLPFATDSESRQLIQQELAETENDDVVFDFWDGAEPTNSNPTTREVFVTSVSSDTANQFGKDLLSVGLTCRSIDAAPFAMSRAIVLMKGLLRNSSILALDLGDQAAAITMVVAGKPVLYRQLRNSGMMQITQALTDGLGLTAADCRTLLQRPGLSNNSKRGQLSELRRAIQELTSKPINKVVGELQKTFRFVQNSHAKTPVQEVVLFGSGAGINGMDTILADVLKVPVKPWTMPRSDALSVPTYLLGQAAGLSVAPLAVTL